MMEKLARAIARHPRLVNAIIARAKRHPYFDIEGQNGTYMGRWWLLRGRGAQGACPWWMRWCPGAIRVHHIMLPDSDRHLHDHPCNFRTVVLRGWYDEEDVFGNVRRVYAGQTYTSAAERFHRIQRVSPGGVWTMFMMGKRRNLWGFLVSNGKVPWHRYLLSASDSEGGEL